MNIGKTFYPKSRAQWRSWLSKNYNKEKEIWVVHYTKGSGKPTISYLDALDEALCFGWIDSTVKKLDQFGRAQRYTPRRPNSPISETNKERLRRLAKAGLVHKRIGEDLDKPYEFPKDIINSIKRNKAAWNNFQAFPAYYKVVRVAFIDGARKRPEEFTKRLNYFIKMSSENKRFGMLI
jgi:uncharacterized protein YdeI (YjbR/CyaY-like superfamily)